jgi:hypothetical protein
MPTPFIAVYTATGRRRSGTGRRRRRIPEVLFTEISLKIAI